MKEKFLQFFTGQMGKSIYISVAAAVVCGAVVITSVVVVHNNNQKIDAVLESLSASESVTESVTESATESVSDLGNEEPQPQAKVANNEPAGDKALQYLAEYDRLTAEYERKKTELEQKASAPNEPNYIQTKPKPFDKSKVAAQDSELYMLDREKYDRLIAQYKAEYEQELKEWEEQSRADTQANEQYKKEYEQKIATAESAKKEIEALDAQYEKDVAALKARYGIA